MIQKKRTKITDEIITKICELYKSGISQKEIAKELDLGSGTVSKYLKLNNINTLYIKDEVGKELIEKYLNGKSLNELQKEYEFKSCTISRYLKKHGIEIRSPFKFNSKEKEQICQDYKDGISEEKLAIKYNSNRITIRNALKEYNIKRRDNSEYRKYSINKNYFDEINTPNKAYILGFLYADGYVSKGKYRIQLSLQEGDIEILEKIKEELDSSAPLEYREFEKYNHKYNSKTQNQWNLSLNCKHMHESLGKWGVVPQKTHVLTYPDFLEKNLHSHFLRGVMDGDGCIHVPYGRNNHSKLVDICGTKMFCEGAKNIIEDILKIHCSVIKTNPDINRDTYRITISGGVQVSKFLDWIYDNSDLKLDRKYQLYLKYYCNNESDEKIA